MFVDAKLVDALPKYLKTMLIKPARKTIWLNHFKKTTFLKNSKYLRIKPINKFGAPARGATVTLMSNQRKHSKTIDAGSGYLCQMEPVAHYGIRKKEKNFKVEIRWTNGSKEMIDIKKLNQTIIVRQK